MVVAASHVADGRVRIFFPSHSHHRSVPTVVVYYKEFPHSLASLHSCHANSATCYNLAHITCEHALRTCIVTCHTPNYCTFSHTNTPTPHTYTHSHTLTLSHRLGCTTCRDFGFLFLTLFSQSVHVHECTHTHTCTYTHSYIHRLGLNNLQSL